jgi:hypothetical protein
MAFMDRLFLPVVLLCAACGGSMSSSADGGTGKAGSGGSKPGADAGCVYDPTVMPANCPHGLPTSCPDPTQAPSYGATVAPLIATYCQPCHRPGGMSADKPFESYAQVHQLLPTIQIRVRSCWMPLACAAQPTAAERGEILQWLVCGSPNN